MAYVYSTAANSAFYTLVSHTTPDGVHIVDKQVLIQGGAGVATKYLVTPRGVATQISDDDLELLQQNKLFQEHVQAGHLSYDKGKKSDADERAQDMAKDTGASPITPNGLAKGGEDASKAGYVEATPTNQDNALQTKIL